MKIKRKSLDLFRIWTVRSAIGVILFGVFYFYTRTELFTITSYDIQGVEGDARTSIVSGLKEAAKKKTLWIIPHDKIFTYSKANITEVVRARVPDLATIRVRPVGSHTVTIHVTHLIPILKIHDSKAITEDGIIFTPVKDIRTYTSITIASSTESTLKIAGLPFTQLSVKGEKVDSLFLDNLLAMSTKVSSLIFPVSDILVEEEGDVTLTNASGTSKVMFLKDIDPKKVWSTLVSAIDTEPLKSKLATNRAGLQYLDVRYGNKVFYRFNDMSFQNGAGAILENHATTTPTNLVATSTPR